MMPTSFSFSSSLRLHTGLKVCLVLLLAVVVISLSLFTSLMHHGDWLSSTADDGGWHDFSHSSSLLFYVYSAFLVDDGPSRDVIRLIAITSPVEWFADQQTDVLCVVRYSHTNHTHVASIVQRLPKVISEPDYVGWLWRKVADYVYTCPLPANQRHRHLVPVQLSIVYKTASKATDATVFMPVTVPRRATKNNEVAVCVKATYDKVEHHRLVEWFELQRLLGVSHVGVYATATIHPDTGRTLAKYAATPLVELRTAKYIDGGYGEKHRRIVGSVTIQDCLYRHVYTHKFVGVYDFDEVIMPRKHLNLPDMMADLYAKFHPPVSNFIFLNTHYFLEAKPDDNISANFTIARLRHRVSPCPYGTAHKSIIVPEYCYSMHYHECSDFVDRSAGKSYNGTSQPYLGGTVVDQSYALSHHYRLCSTCVHKPATCDELLNNTIVDDAVLRFRRQLIDNVQRVLSDGILNYYSELAIMLSGNATVV